METKEKKLNLADKTIFMGDNLPIMRGMNSECVDLIYLDPPFNSNANYAAPIGSKAAGAEFKDTWTLEDVDISWLDLMEAKYPAMHRVIQATMRNSDKAYLIYMAIRLIEMHRILKNTGSIYLHCDPTMSHYLKLLMDAIFGRKNFRNEIVWWYRKFGQGRKNFKKDHDVILYYSKTENCKFTPQYVPFAPKTKPAKYGRKIQNGRVVEDKTVLMKDIRDESRGTVAGNTWEISFVRYNSKENTGYRTQKPLKLLERIIQASSDEGDIVLDPFCGGATTCVAAERLGRGWIGIDFSPKAVQLVEERIKEELYQDIRALKHTPKRTDLRKLPKYNSPENKKKLYGEQMGYCNGCGIHFNYKNLDVDHIIALAVGGTDHIDNLQLLCGHCNSIKGQRGQEYLIARLNSYSKPQPIAWNRKIN
ncbi:MAG: DNA methyltransferase [Cytophagales bacterium]|nr:DNA methyltransferase [Cytophagales bacterium]